jgi:membrane-bound lytic murein transglycosylase A
VAAALPAFRRSCAKLLATPEASASAADDSAKWQHGLRPACVALAALADGDEVALRRFLEQWFRPYRVSDGAKSEGLFTGYYEPELKGARRAGGPYRVPLYGEPKDLVTVDLGAFDESLKGKHVTGRVDGHALAPYPSRIEIEAGALEGKAPELLWLADPIELFFLQIQGSGRVALEDGGIVHVGYAAANGRHYSSIGKLLVEWGAMTLPEVNLASLKAWLRGHPDEAKALMDENAAYVFFRELSGDGPIGGEGVALTPGRSLAVDPKFVLLGLPLWLDIESPAAGARIRRLVVAQDVGGAIKGPLRGDLFWGHGAEAEDMAGRMRSSGSYYFLLPRGE